MNFFSILSIFLLISGLFINSSQGGGLEDVEHIIIFMQENRAFDHYYGKLAGVRGFGDRAAPPLPSGLPPFYQPMQKGNDSNYQLPYHIDMIHTSASCMDAPEMSYPCDINMWNRGKMDQWNTARDSGYGLGYFQKEDLPYYYALADAFLIGDQYFQASFTQTNPNRLFLFTSSNGPSALKGQSAILDNTEPDEGFGWDTLGELLERSNISWKVYQQEDNFDDNAFAWFTNYKNAKPGSPLYDKGIAIVPDLCNALAADMENGSLPSVSIIVGPTALSEHATNHPAAGEDLSARLIQVLRDHPDIYAKTVFILNYDEGGQFYDHHWTPTTPTSSDDGISTVDVSDEIVNNQYGFQNVPIGLGFRVPLLIISPWTRNGGVISQVLSHTSVGLFIEKKFNITIKGMSEWRRTVTGDLLAAFDWNHPDYSWPVLPDTSSYVNDSNYQCDHYPRPIIPTVQSMPSQYPGIKPSRTLPYSFSFTDTIISSTTIELVLSNNGEAGAAFQLYDWQNLNNPLGPKKYTVSSGKNINDRLVVINNNGYYQFSLHGPNGWVRYLTGFTDYNNCTVSIQEDASNGLIIVKYSNSGLNTVCSFLSDNNPYSNDGPWSFTVYPTRTISQKISVAESGNWYDITVNVLTKSEVGKKNDNKDNNSNNNNPSLDPSPPSYQRRFMGRVERPGCTSDPAIGNPLITLIPPSSHPPNPPYQFSSSSKKKRIMRSRSSKANRNWNRNEKDSLRCWNQPFHLCKDDL